MFLMIFGFYVWNQKLNFTENVPPVITPPPIASSPDTQGGAGAVPPTQPVTAVPVVVPKPTPTVPVSKPISTPPPVSAPVPAPVPTPAPKPVGLYKDGTFTGKVADAYYGNVQVQITAQGGKITDIQFLDYPHDRDTSRMINSYAMPTLKTEAIQAQSASISGASGASFTSQAFIESLSSALAKAKN